MENLNDQLWAGGSKAIDNLIKIDHLQQINNYDWKAQIAKFQTSCIDYLSSLGNNTYQKQDHYLN
jgi:hypothetical protein